MSLKSFIEPEECRKCKGHVCRVEDKMEKSALGDSVYYCFNLKKNMKWVQVLQKFMDMKEYRNWQKGR